jgi:hypothetical protein
VIVPFFNIHALKEYEEAALKLYAQYASYNMAINCYVHILISLPGAETLDVVQRGKFRSKERLNS